MVKCLLIFGLLLASQLQAQVPGPSTKDSLAMLTKLNELKAERQFLETQSIQWSEELYHTGNLLKQIQSRLSTTDSSLAFLRKQITDMDNQESKSTDTKKMIRTGKEMIKEHERMISSMKGELAEAGRRKSDAERLLQKSKMLLDEIIDKIMRMEELLR